MMGKTQLLPAPVWDAERLKTDVGKAIAIFRDERMREPLDVYVEKFEECKDAFDELLEETVDLSQLRDRALEILGDAKLQEALRYLASPQPARFIERGVDGEQQIADMLRLRSLEEPVQFIESEGQPRVAQKTGNAAAFRFRSRQNENVARLQLCPFSAGSVAQ